MSRRIILSADESVTCPACGREFPLYDGIAQQTIERYADAYGAALKAEKKQLQETAQMEAERQLARSYSERLRILQDELEEGRRLSEKLKAGIEHARKQAATDARTEFENRVRELEQSLAIKEKKLAEHRAHELKLRCAQNELEESKREFEVQIQRRLAEEKERLARKMSESYGLREAEYRKKIDDAHKVNDELRKKLEQGSQQLRGEVLELEVEDILSTAFPLDQIEEVKKGVRGADVIQTVMTRTGISCGKLVWESKRAENWSGRWIPKLKDDQQAAGAELAVLVSTAFPFERNEPFLFYENVWIVRPYAVRPVAEALRMTLLEKQKQKVINAGRREKVEALYDYLCGPRFAQRIRGVIDAYAAMKNDLDRERAAMERLWKKREMQLQRITANMMGLSGELQGIAENALPGLDDFADLPNGEQQHE